MGVKFDLCPEEDGKSYVLVDQKNLLDLFKVIFNSAPGFQPSAELYCPVTCSLIK